MNNLLIRAGLAKLHPRAVLAFIAAVLANTRTRSALLAFLFGNLGVDMLMLPPHQQRLFLLIAGPLVAAVVLCTILSVTHAPGWAMVSVVALVLLTLWSVARCFEYLSLTDESFAQLLAESNAPAHQFDPATIR